ncbi:MAG TPA: hypothetical protein VNF73_06285 [Candidatus Saccharimonadales bacterium]|nr:hypothetical protein [Candidatus Saccharimonadales bacterium]
MIQLTCPWCDGSVELVSAPAPEQLACEACGVVVDVVDPAEPGSRDVARAA